MLKSDPITFATDAIGHYAVLVNANDIATSGAVPRWLLTTLLFPPGTAASEILEVMNDLKTVAAQWGITLCGGHTEISDAVTRPVVTGMLAGEVARGDLIDKRHMRPGDSVLMTKRAAAEGTAIIAREFAGRLTRLGLAADVIDACKAFLADISVLAEAAIAGRTKGVSAMHDVTEGGVATALEELSIAGRHRIRIHLDRIPVFPQTRTVCRLLDLHPLGLIASGSLLICCRETAADCLQEKIRAAGIEATCIGRVMDGGRGVEALDKGRPANWPHFEVDEIARLF